MARIAKIPSDLSTNVVTLADAQEHGLGEWRLRTRAWRRVGPGTYVPADLPTTPDLRIEAATRRLPKAAAFSGRTAAWLHGLDVEPCDPIEVTIPAPTTVSSRSGMVVRRRAMESHDITLARGYRVTSIVRTLSDLCPRLALVEGVVLVDMALHMGLVALDDLKHRRELEKLIPHAEPLSESPMETRLRMMVVLGGLPRPEAQVTIYDRWHRPIGRPDLYYREQRLGLEYDGLAYHQSLAEDNRRQNRLLQAGVRLLRFTAADVLGSPDAVVAAVRAALAAR